MVTDYGLIADAVGELLESLTINDKDLTFERRSPYRVSALFVNGICLICIRDKVEIYPTGELPYERTISFNDPLLKEKVLHEISLIKARK